MDFTNDCIFGLPIEDATMEAGTGNIMYSHNLAGQVKITLQAYTDLHSDLAMSNGQSAKYNRWAFAGITRNSSERSQPAPLVDTNFINGGYAMMNPPSTFKEKKTSLLRLLHDTRGLENRNFELHSGRDFPLSYSDADEFVRVVDALLEDQFLHCSKRHPMGRNMGYLYTGVSLTPKGLSEVEAQLPQVPLIGLVRQEISTGDSKVDEQINHAKDLFFSPAATMNNKRSACETLSYVLKPLRTELSTFFTSSDVSDFFQIVNRFDVRHNKESTIKIIHEEQLEWVFYTLLNCLVRRRLYTIFTVDACF